MLLGLGLGKSKPPSYRRGLDANGILVVQAHLSGDNLTMRPIACVFARINNHRLSGEKNFVSGDGFMEESALGSIVSFKSKRLPKRPGFACARDPGCSCRKKRILSWSWLGEYNSTQNTVKIYQPRFSANFGDVFLNVSGNITAVFASEDEKNVTVSSDTEAAMHRTLLLGFIRYPVGGSPKKNMYGMSVYNQISRYLSHMAFMSRVEQQRVRV